MKKKLLSILTTALFSALFVTFMGGCSQEPPETGSAKTGLISINLSANVPVSAPSARTALPPLTFTSYRLVFDPESGADREEKVDSADWNGTVQIPTGSYTKLTVYGYDVEKEAISTDNHTASGESADFEVSQGETTDVSVPMTFKAPQGGTGTVKYTVTNTSGYTLTATKLSITPLAGGETTVEDIFVGSEQTKGSLPAGYYFATVTLQVAGLEASRSDVVHVYPNQTTTLSWTFEVGDFHSAIEKVWLVGTMANSWAAGGVAMTAAEDGTFYWEGDVAADSTFRFLLTDVSDTSYENKWWADWFSSVSDGAPGDGGYNPDITLNTATPMFFYSGTTNGNWKIATTGYYRITVDPYAKTMTVTAPPVVTGVTINDGNVNLPQGGGKSFTAVVAGHNSPDQGVTWAISGDGLNDGTAIVSDTGVFTIAEAETVGKVITVTATSTADTSKSGAVTVTVTSAETPTVTGITVTTAGEVSEVEKGATLDFNALVTITNGAEKTVAWTVTNTDGSEVSETTNTKVTPKGTANSGFDVSATLTIAEADRGKTLKVTAASTVDGFTHITGSATVFARKYGNVYLIGDEFGNWTDTGTVEMTYAGLGVYTKTELMSKGKSFRFRDNSTEANHFEPWTDNQTPSGTVDAWRHQPTENTTWTTTQGGSYAISLNTATEDVTFTLLTQQVITITGGNTDGYLLLGENTTFTATAAITDDKHQIAWKVYGDEPSHTNNLITAGTSINTSGTLTVGTSDWTGHTLYVTAESLGEAVTFEQYPVLKVPIIDSTMYVVGEMNRDGSGNWSVTGTEMTRNGAIFTWTGNMYDYNGRRDFRLSPNTGIDEENAWKKTWIVPSGTNENDNRKAWITNDILSTETDRLTTTTTERGWFINLDNGNYTITYDAINKTVSVTRNGDPS